MEGMVANTLFDTYKGKRVFLTGHTGFKGSWLLKTLNLLGAEIMGYALPPKNPNDLYNLVNGDELCTSVISDLRDKEKLKRTVVDFQPDFVFHLAAQPLVRLSYDLPEETFEVNAIGTANLLGGIRALKKACSIVLITTDKVYHNREWIYSYREVDRLGGYDPYSASKACAELVIDSYRNSFFNIENYSEHLKALAIARAGNVIGGGDWAKDRLIPDIVKALGNKQTIIVRNPSAIRPWQHVLEPLIGYLILGKKLEENPRAFSQPYNFGPYSEDEISVEEMVKLSINRWGEGEYEKPQLFNQLHEAGLLKLDISRAISDLNWKPVNRAIDSIEMTIDWYKTYYQAKNNVSILTENQILNYLK